MWPFLVLSLAVLNVDCYYTTRERLEHGRRLSIKISKEIERLEFKPADGTSLETIWDRGMHHPRKGQITGSMSSSSSSDNRWELKKVVFDDEGTYILRDHWNKESKSILLAVTTANKYIDRVAGHDLVISLEGSNQHEATLKFSGEAGNFTLVRDGALVANDLEDYVGRVKISSTGITISNVNTSDVGRYRLYDRRDRLVSVTKMILVEAYENELNPLLGLLVLLGIPAGICCCCRKKIFRQKATTTATHIQVDNPPPGGPPSYNTPTTPMPQPGMDGQGYAPGYPMAGGGMPPPQQPGYQQPGYPQPAMPPGPGFQQGYDPQNPIYPPLPGPAGPPQWNGPPPSNQYNPAVAPGYAPVAYSAPPQAQTEPVKEEIKMSDMTPAAPLLAQEGQPSAPTVPNATVNSSAGAAQFDLGKNTNFL